MRYSHYCREKIRIGVNLIHLGISEFFTVEDFCVNYFKRRGTKSNLWQLVLLSHVLLNERLNKYVEILITK